MKKLWRLLLFFGWTSFMAVGCSGGGGGGGTPATGVFVDKPVQGIKYVFGGYSGLTGSGGTFTYAPGSKGTFSVGNLVIGQAVGAATVTLVDLVKTAQPAITDAQALIEATKIAQVMMTLDSGTNPQVITISPTVSENLKVPDMVSVNLLTANLQNICSTGRPGAVFVNSSSARTQLTGSISNLGLLKHSGEYVSSFFGGDTAANIIIHPDGTLAGIAANFDGEVFDLTGTVTAAGDIAITPRPHGSSTPIVGTTVTAKSDGFGTIIGSAVDTTVTPAKTIPFTLTRVTSATNKFTGFFSGSYSGTNAGNWAFAVDLQGRLIGFADNSQAETLRLSGTVNQATGVIVLTATGSSSGVTTLNGRIAANGSVSGTWTNLSSSGSGSIIGIRFTIL